MNFFRIRASSETAITSFRGPYSYLSNFFLCKISYEGLIYPSAEHAFQAAKTTSKAVRIAIRDCHTPGSAKSAGRQITLRPDWEDVKIDVMRDILRAKFGQNTVLRFALLDTGDVRLEEGNHHGDKFWGTVDGWGENHLGRLLMDVRAELRREQSI